ncbi:MAG: RimK family protein [Sulfuricella sp.]|nr:RimK family protein [Sulfuricella sp.]
MSVLIVVDNLRGWPRAISGARIVSAQAYMADPAMAGERAAKVCNLCDSYQYQSVGYYVSLLAEARGHRVLPKVGAIEDLKSPDLVRLLVRDIGELIQRSLEPVQSDLFELGIYFGRCEDKNVDPLCRRLFGLLRMPLLRLTFEPRGHLWRILGARPIAFRDILPAQRESFDRALQEYVLGFEGEGADKPRYHLAMLVDPDNPEPPSDAGAMRQFRKAALLRGMRTTRIGAAEIERLGAFDALFIRDTTFANHYTYRFSRRAVAEGLAVIDDPGSILKCNNKVYLAELLGRHGIPTPRTLIVHRGNLHRVIPELGLPCVLKQPDSSFSLGVAKVESERELYECAGEYLEKSALIVAQEYLFTEFDWRVGILDRRPLFVCKYFMAAGHWQIIRRGEQRLKIEEGLTVAVPFDETPEQVMKIALEAANLIGDGFYGVDIKEVGGRYCVIEINDNPNVDAGHEDGVRKEALYGEVMAVFLKRIEERKRGDVQ